MKRTVITVGSVTLAVKAKKLLLRDGITARLVKASAVSDAGGCTHGIEIPAKDLFAAAEILRAAGIGYSVYEK